MKSVKWLSNTRNQAFVMGSLLLVLGISMVTLLKQSTPTSSESQLAQAAEVASAIDSKIQESVPAAEASQTDQTATEGEDQDEQGEGESGQQASSEQVQGVSSDQSQTESDDKV